MGPNSDDREVMKQLLLNGMDVARFNFSHGTHDEQRARYKQLREVAEEVGKPVAALLDTKGPEIRKRRKESNTDSRRGDHPYNRGHHR